MFTTSRLFGRVCAVALQSWQSLTAVVFNPYHPELHYMRGPGPRWYDKHPAKKFQVIGRTGEPPIA